MTAVAEALSPADLRKLTVKLEKEATRRVSENKLASFKAYSKEREFFAAGKKRRERLLMAANRRGPSPILPDGRFGSVAEARGEERIGQSDPVPEATNAPTGECAERPRENQT